MGLWSFFRSAGNMLKLSKKSDWSEFILYLKLTILGLAAVGTIGFLIKFLLDILLIGK